MPADLVSASPSETRRDLRIGQAAAIVGVSTRTLRYYEELGLLHPSSRSPGGGRRYCEEDLARLLRIRELQSLMGFNLRDIQDHHGRGGPSAGSERSSSTGGDPGTNAGGRS